MMTVTIVIRERIQQLQYANSDGDTCKSSSSNICERANLSDVLNNDDCDDSDAGEKPTVTWYAEL